MRARGDVTITLAGKERTLRPTFEAIEMIEDRTGRGLVALLGDISRGAFGAREIVTVIWAGLHGAGLPLERSQVGEWVMADGLGDFIRPVGELLQNALTGGKAVEDAEGKAASSTSETDG